MEDSREGKGDDEKVRRMPDPHVDDKKCKKAIVYKTRKGKKKREMARTCQERLLATFEACVFNLFTLKSNILAQDQTSFLSCTL